MTKFGCSLFARLLSAHFSECVCLSEFLWEKFRSDFCSCFGWWFFEVASLGSRRSPLLRPRKPFPPSRELSSSTVSPRPPCLVHGSDRSLLQSHVHSLSRASGPTGGQATMRLNTSGVVSSAACQLEIVQPAKRRTLASRCQLDYPAPCWQRNVRLPPESSSGLTQRSSATCSSLACGASCACCP